MHASKLLASLFALGAGLSATPALAQSPWNAPSPDLGAPAATPSPSRQFAPAWDEAAEGVGARRWYGWQMLIGYGASDAALASSFATFGAGSPPAGTALFVMSLAGHTLVGPVTHWSHGDVGRGFASLGMTLGATAVGGGTGLGIAAAAMAPHRSGDGELDPGAGLALGFVLGATVGMVTANVIDASALAYARPKKSSVVGSLRLAPVVAPKLGGVAVAGVF